VLNELSGRLGQSQTVMADPGHADGNAIRDELTVD
jgi:hypothetical protein